MSMLEETYEDLFVDVGANIGKYVLTGLIFGIQTLAVEPITDNIDAICGGWQETTKRLEIGVNGSRHVTLLQAAASKKSSDAVNISRPLGRGAKLDQSSLFGNTIGVVRRPKLSYDVVPMIRLDEVIPVDIPVGLVKIDVQGAEKWVLHGMEGLLNRTHGYPVYVYFEEQKRVLLKAGIAKQGENQAYLESFGYKCENLYNDVKCYKARANRNAFHSHYRF